MKYPKYNKIYIEVPGPPTSPLTWSQPNLVDGIREVFVTCPLRLEVIVVAVEPLNQSEEPCTKSCRHVCRSRNPNLTTTKIRQIHPDERTQGGS